jgi:gas vesicle protein
MDRDPNKQYLTGPVMKTTNKQKTQAQIEAWDEVAKEAQTQIQNLINQLNRAQDHLHCCIAARPVMRTTNRQEAQAQIEAWDEVAKEAQAQVQDLVSRLNRAQDRLHSCIAARAGAEAILKAIDFP